MRFFLALTIIGLILVSGASAAIKAQPVKVWDDAIGVATGQYKPADGRYEEVQIDTTLSGIRFVYGHNIGWAEKDADDVWWYFFCFNDSYGRVNTITFTEEQIGDPGSWVQQYVFDDPEADLRYTSCQIVEADGYLYPQAFIHTGSTVAVVDYTYDEFGMAGGGWTTTEPLNDPTLYPDDYCAYLPLTYPVDGTGEIHMDGQGRGLSDDSHWYWKSDLTGERVLGPTSILPSPGWEEMPPAYAPHTVYGLGYEASSLASDALTSEIVVIQCPGYQIDEYVDSTWADLPENPLNPAVRISRDGGATWGDRFWLDKETVPDLPGTYPGCESMNQWGWMKNLAVMVTDDEVIHFMMTITDPANNTAPDHPDSLGLVAYGIYHVAGTWNGTDWVWSANLATTGNGLRIPGEYDATWVNHPKLALTPDGELLCTFSDIGYVDPADSNYFVDIFAIGSANGSQWGEVVNITDTNDRDEQWFKVVEYTTDTHACIYGLPHDYNSEGPLLAYFFPLDDIEFPGVSADPFQKAISLTLGEAYPNPSMGLTELQFSLGDRANVAVTVHDLAGRQVATISDGWMEAGTHNVVWDGKDAASGVYFIQVAAGGKTASKPVALVR